jgi:hypothetical protein
LTALARKLGHSAAQSALDRPFVRYVANDAPKVSQHFYGLREAVPHLQGAAVFDRLDRELPQSLGPQGLMWRKREMENYLTTRDTLMAYARATSTPEVEGPLFEVVEADRRARAMEEAITDVESALSTLGKGSPWAADLKASDDFLVPLFRSYYQKLGLPNVMSKSNFHQLADYVPIDQIDPEVTEKLDAIAEVSRAAVLPAETE